MLHWNTRRILAQWRIVTHRRRSLLVKRTAFRKKPLAGLRVIPMGRRPAKQ
jgi:hypothetical protein